jgi:dUTP pyrophosphatase
MRDAGEKACRACRIASRASSIFRPAIQDIQNGGRIAKMEAQMTPTMTIAVTRLRSDATVPEYQSAGAAGMDLSAALDAPIEIPPGEHRLVPTGLAVAVPPGYEAQVRPRSGLAAKFGVTVLNAPGTIDSDYRGEVKVILIIHGGTVFAVAHGMRIAQMVIAPVVQASWEIVAELPETTRGAGGFGHTGH